MSEIEVVNAIDLPCPLPLLKTKKALNLASKGTKIVIQATDLNSKKDIASLCNKLNLPMQIFEKKDFFEIHIEKLND